MDKIFSLKGANITEVKSQSHDILCFAIGLMDSIPSSIPTSSLPSSPKIQWTLSKKYQSTDTVSTATYKATINNKFWATRSCIIDCKKSGITYSEFLFELTGSAKQDTGDYSIEDAYTHTAKEINYIHELVKWEKGANEVVKVQDEEFRTELSIFDVELRYYFGAPLRHRHFSNILVIGKPIVEEEFETSYIISIPNSKGIPFEKDDTKARYVSIEKIKYNKKTDQIKWEMTTASDAGGYLPRWLQNMSVCKAVSKDVPSYLGYLKSRVNK